MKRIAAIHVYDAMETVQVSFLVREYEDYEQGESTIVLQGGISFLGVGEPWPASWLQDALVYLAETL